jgi:ferredoxin
MVKAKPKPIEEIISYIERFNKILIAGCNGCVTVCEAGGIKEVAELASALRIYFGNKGQERVVDETSLTRQCEREYILELKDRIDNYDAVVSLACGAGIQYVAEVFESKLVFPGVDTCFVGVGVEQGSWSERCQTCGTCILASTGGICPITRCSKRMLNGPCGGSSKGTCEVNKEIACGWQLIYDRLKTLGELDRFEKPTDAKDWTTSRDGGPRKIVKEVSQI